MIEPELVKSFALAIAILIVLRVACAFLHGICGFYRYFLRSAKNLKEFGDWAIITGATDGIGKAVALELARKGMNVALIGRSAEKLAATEAEIMETKCNVQVKKIEVDFKQFDAATAARVSDALNGLSIGILVNNVGQSYEFPKYFHELSFDEISGLSKVNIESTLFMTHVAVPLMRSTKTKKGLVVNISSASSLYNAPLLAVYAASKALMNSFSAALSAEYSKPVDGKSILVECYAPFYVMSKLSKIRVPSFFTPTPKTFARSLIRAMGQCNCCCSCSSSSSVLQSYWPHALQVWLIDNLVPGCLVNMIVKMQHAAIRAKGMKKREGKKSD